MKKNIYLLVIVALVAACAPTNATQSPIPQIAPTPQPTSTSTPIPQEVNNLICLAFPSAEGCPTPTSVPPYVYELPQDYLETFSGSDWEQNPVLLPDFMIGNTFMDVYGTNIYQPYFESTAASMRNSGAGWMVYENFWSYSSFEPPVIVPYGDTPDFRNATDEEVCHMAETAHANGQKFALMLGLNADIARGEWQSWEDQQKFYENVTRLLFEKSEDIAANSKWWDAWFIAYEGFVVDQAQLAQQCHADMLVIGHTLDGAVKSGTADRWRLLISHVRNSFTGPLSYGAWTNETYSQADDFPFDALDYIIIYIYNNISSAENPTIPDLIASFEQFNNTQFEPLSQKYNKPVIFLTPFQSRDHGAQQVWFEPATVSPEVGEDLLTQAKLYEAFFQAIQDEAWVAGVWTWGYWWRDDFDTLWEPGDASFNKSSSVRNKPAMWIIEKWNDSITPVP